MEAKATWQSDMSFIGTADTGFEVRMDASEASGGHNSGFRPTELLAMGTARLHWYGRDFYPQEETC
jgi:putative redox protein